MAEKTQMVLSKMKKVGKPVRPGDIVKMTALKESVAQTTLKRKPMAND